MHLPEAYLHGPRSTLEADTPAGLDVLTRAVEAAQLAHVGLDDSDQHDPDVLTGPAGHRIGRWQVSADDTNVVIRISHPEHPTGLAWDPALQDEPDPEAVDTIVDVLATHHAPCGQMKLTIG